jgi:hypothetical protein
MTVKLTFIGSTDGKELGCLTAQLSNGLTTQYVAIPWVTGLATVMLLAVAAGLGIAGGSKAATFNASGNPTTSAPAPEPSSGFTSDPSSGVLHGMSGGNAGGHSAFQTTGKIEGATRGWDAAPHSTGAVTPHTGHSGPPADRMDPTALFLHFQSISSAGLLSLNYPSVYHAFTTNFAWANLIIPIGSFRRAAAHMRKCTVSSGNTAIPTVDPGVSTGIATYSSRLGIDRQDIFGIVYLVLLCACLVLLGLYVLASAIIHVMVHQASKSGDEEKKAKWEAWKGHFAHMSSNNTLRLVSGLFLVS